MVLALFGTPALLPAKASLGFSAAACVAQYRELLRKHGPVDQGSAAFQHAKERALRRLKERKSTFQHKINPKRAFYRLRDRLLLVGDPLGNKLQLTRDLRASHLRYLNDEAAQMERIVSSNSIFRVRERENI